MKKTASAVRFQASALCLAFCAGAAICLPAPASAQTPAAAAAPTTVEQAYTAPRFRDPFVVSTVFGDEHAPKSRVAISNVAGSTFTAANLSVTGIMEDSRGKEALLTDKVAGASYVLKGGRLFDAKKKQVPDISGVIKGKQVILMTGDKNVYQLNLHEKE